MPFTTATGLVRFFQTGQIGPDTWRELVDHYGPAIFGWCVRQGLQSADADDVAQEVLVKMFRRIEGYQYDPAVGFRPYLRKLIQSAVIDGAERLKKLGRCDGDADGLLECQPARDDLEATLHERFDLETLAEAKLLVARKVDEKTWEAFRLQAIDGQSAADVAAQLGMSIASAYKAKSNVQKWLRETVQELEGAERADSTGEAAASPR